MKIVLALIIGLLFGAGVHMMLHRSLFKLILGVILFSYACVLFLFVVSGVTRDVPALIPVEGGLTRSADPLPQALSLTAIVIGIGIQLFVIMMLKKVFDTIKTDDLDELNKTDQIDERKERI